MTLPEIKEWLDRNPGHPNYDQVREEYDLMELVLNQFKLDTSPVGKLTRQGDTDILPKMTKASRNVAAILAEGINKVKELIDE